MTFRIATLVALFVGVMTTTAQDTAKPMSTNEFMKKVNTYLREQDAVVTEEAKSVRDALRKTSADMDLQSKTIVGIQAKLKELQQELAKMQMENLRLKKDVAKSAAKQGELIAAEKRARADGDLKLAAQLTAVIKKTNTMIRTVDTPPPATATPSRKYVVQAGDTLGAIAHAFNTTVTSIKTANELTNNTIRIGQKLTIPGK